MIGISMVRDEADIIERTLNHLWAQGVDRIVVLDNGSTDGTTEILHDLRCEVLYEPEATFLHANRMSWLATEFAKEDEWVIPFDGDELWTFTADGTADVLRCHPWVCLPDGTRTHQERLWKCMGRYREGFYIETGNHGIGGAGHRIADDLLEIEHYQYRSLEQVKRKVRNGNAALERAGEHPMKGTHWRDLAKLDDDEIAQWWADYLCRR